MADDDDDEPVQKHDNTSLALAVQRLKDQRAQLRAQLAERDAKLAEHAAAAKEWAAEQKVATKIATERDALVAEKNGWAEERAILGAGVTEAEGIDYIRFAYGRVPETERPKGGLTEWLGDREKLSKGVQNWLPEAKTETKAEVKTGAKPAPSPNTGVKPAPQSNGGGLAASLAAGGSIADIRASYEPMWAELGVPAPPLPKAQS